MFKNLLKQHNIGVGWGRIEQSATRLSFYVTMLNLFLLLATAYATTFFPWMKEHGFVVPFWVFLLVILLLLVLTLLFIYKITLPAFFSSWNEQFYKHNNPMRADIQALQSKVNELCELIKVNGDADGNRRKGNGVVSGIVAQTGRKKQ